MRASLAAQVRAPVPRGRETTSAVEWANSAVLASKVSAGCSTLAYISLFNLWARRSESGFPSRSAELRSGAQASRLWLCEQELRQHGLRQDGKERTRESL